ncbi:Uma2 family endonuclease [Alkalinema sp. FACHB-956]|uniref:Uma2 family endonuclease n=1 Tax=Alkalinema sp. FACHB-956 TaxID=2692768 RepID=UPI0016874304|nr:Uma2 family endonuclease [Alkalinema sp. FACHB-956]MBD2325862.1 Uma2 family endonuclease [Alkalinema sp. FACHB-956]
MVSNTVPNALKWTTRDLTIMPDDGGWVRHEIIDGELYVTRAPHIQHQGASGNFHFELEAWSRKTQLGKPYQVPGVIFTPTDAVIPDVVWISHDRLANGLDESGHLIVAPELIIEILSPGEQNQQRDRELKLKLYSRHGVQEYWIADWQQQAIAVYRHREGMLQLETTLLANDTLTSPLLPGFSTSVAMLFQ